MVTVPEYHTNLKLMENLFITRDNCCLARSRKTVHKTDACVQPRELRHGVIIIILKKKWLCCNVLRADLLYSLMALTSIPNAEKAVPPHTVYNIMMFPYKQTAQLHLHRIQLLSTEAYISKDWSPHKAFWRHNLLDCHPRDQVLIAFFLTYFTHAFFIALLSKPYQLTIIQNQNTGPLIAKIYLF